MPAVTRYRLFAAAAIAVAPLVLPKLARVALAAVVTDTSKLMELALAISSSSPKIRAYAIEQARVSVSQELALVGLNERLVRLEAPAPAPEPVPPTPTPTFGADLALRLAESPGSITEVATLAALRTAVASLVPGSIIRVTAPIDMGGTDLVLNRQATAAAPITLTGTAPIRNGRILISRAAYLRVQLASEDSPIDGYKITDGSHHIEVDLDGRKILRSKRTGILQTDPACYDWQVWNARIWDCGSLTNQDHGVYAAAARGTCVIANVEVSNPQAYGLQIYPDSQGLLVTCVTLKGGRTRGGIIVGIESGQVTRDITVVGAIITDSKVAAIETYPPGYVVAGGKAFDCIEFGNASGYKPGMSYENCVNADPLVSAKGHIRSARFGLVPALDLDGKPRATGDAGCVAVLG